MVEVEGLLGGRWIVRFLLFFRTSSYIIGDCAAPIRYFKIAVFFKYGVGLVCSWRLRDCESSS